MFRQKQNICRIKNRGSAPLIRIRHRFQTKLKTWVRFQIGVDFSSAIFVVFFFVFLCSSICEKCTNIHSEVNKGGHGALIAGSGLVDQTLNYLCVLPGLHNFHLCLDGFHHRHILHRKPTNIARFLCSTTFVYPSCNLISESTLLSSYPRLSFVARLMCFIYQFVDSYIPCCFIYTSNSN